MAVPKLHDQFWFDYSETMVKDSILRLNQAIHSVKTFTKAVIGFYPVATIAVIEYKNIDNWFLLILFISPYAFVLYSAWQGTSSVVPKSVSFDPRIPEDIRRAYLETHTYKEKELKKAVTISLVTTMLASLALMVGFILGNYYTRQEEEKKLEIARIAELEKERGEYYFDAEFLQKEEEVSIAGNFPSGEKLFVSVTNFYSDGNNKVIYDKQHVNTKKGVFAINIPLDSVGVRSEVEIKYAGPDFSRALIKEISTVRGPLKPKL